MLRTPFNDCAVCPKNHRGPGPGDRGKLGAVYGFHLTKAAHASATVITRSTTWSLALV
jgi:hypothetical protein